VLLATDYQRQDYQEQCAGQGRHPKQVNSPGCPRVALSGQEAQGGEQDGAADWHVHQEDRAPLGPEQVARDEHAAENLPGHRATGESSGVEAEGARPLPSLEAQLDPGQHLRDRERRADSLDDPGHDQRDRTGSKAAREGGQGEDAQPDKEKPPEPAHLAQPRARDEQHGVGEEVTAEDQLELGTGRPQLRANGRAGDVDNGGVA
jgi:hypothetical protein